MTCPRKTWQKSVTLQRVHLMFGWETAWKLGNLLAWVRITPLFKSDWALFNSGLWLMFSAENKFLVGAGSRTQVCRLIGKHATSLPPSLIFLGEFGNEGSGGQSYLVYPWTSGKTYRFLIRASPQKSSNSTVFSGKDAFSDKPSFHSALFAVQLNATAAGSPLLRRRG